MAQSLLQSWFGRSDKSNVIDPRDSEFNNGAYRASDDRYYRPKRETRKGNSPAEKVGSGSHKKQNKERIGKIAWDRLGPPRAFDPV